MKVKKILDLIQHADPETDVRFFVKVTVYDTADDLRISKLKYWNDPEFGTAKWKAIEGEATNAVINYVTESGNFQIFSKIECTLKDLNLNPPEKWNEG